MESVHPILLSNKDPFFLAAGDPPCSKSAQTITFDLSEHPPPQELQHTGVREPWGRDRPAGNLPHPLPNTRNIYYNDNAAHQGTPTPRDLGSRHPHARATVDLHHLAPWWTTITHLGSVHVAPNGFQYCFWWIFFVVAVRVGDAVESIGLDRESSPEPVAVTCELFSEARHPCPRLYAIWGAHPGGGWAPPLSGWGWARIGVRSRAGCVVAGCRGARIGGG